MEDGVPEWIAGSFLTASTFLKDATRTNVEAARSEEMARSAEAAQSEDILFISDDFGIAGKQEAGPPYVALPFFVPELFIRFSEL